MGKGQCITVLSSLQLSKTGTDGEKTGSEVHRERKESITVKTVRDGKLRDGSGCIRHLKMNEDIRGRRGEVEVKMSKSSHLVF